MLHAMRLCGKHACVHVRRPSGALRGAPDRKKKDPFQLESSQAQHHSCGALLPGRPGFSREGRSAVCGKLAEVHVILTHCLPFRVWHCGTGLFPAAG